MKKRLILAIFLIFFLPCLVLILSGCWEKGELIEETLVIDLEEVDEVQAIIALYQGSLHLFGIDQQSLLISDFSYNLMSWIPQITYTVEENDKGYLKIVQTKNERRWSNSLVNDWSLAFNQAIPIGLDIVMGSGENHLDLSLIHLTDLKAAIGTGDTFIDLTGDYQQNITVHLIGGIGRTMINLPEGIGVRIMVNGMLNRINCDGFNRIGNFYYNKAFFDFSERKIFITIVSGLGMIDIHLL